MVVSNPHVVPAHEASPGLLVLHCVLVWSCTHILGRRLANSCLLFQLSRSGFPSRFFACVRSDV